VTADVEQQLEHLRYFGLQSAKTDLIWPYFSVDMRKKLFLFLFSFCFENQNLNFQITSSCHLRHHSKVKVCSCYLPVKAVWNLIEANVTNEKSDILVSAVSFFLATVGYSWIVYFSFIISGIYFE
jgi:hypothetical protein